jgi:deoxyadenosine/deoxycytidine kinase
VQDRSLYEDAMVFARNLHERGSMSGRDWDVYLNLYRAVVSLLPPPDLVVYLRASVPTLKKRIALRGRGFEASISDEYLSGLNRLYEDWIENFTLSPVLVVPGDRLDFVAETGDLDAIVETTARRLRDRQGILFPYGM